MSKINSEATVTYKDADGEDITGEEESEVELTASDDSGAAALGAFGVALAASYFF